MKLKAITSESYPMLKPYYDAFRIEASELCFTNLLMWNHKYNFHYALIDDYLWIANVCPSDTLYFSQPIGDYNNTEGLLKSIQTLKQLLCEEGRPFVVKKADSRFVTFLNTVGVAFENREDRNSFDYIYDFVELSALKGNKYHKKKNHVNKFHKTVTSFVYHPLNQDTLPQLMKSYTTWFDKHPRPGMEKDFEEEILAIRLGLENFEMLGLEGGFIEIDGVIEAYTFGEFLNSDTFLVHIEKANNEIHGLYPFINQHFLQQQSRLCQWVNREQDLGIEGLRKAKLSYHPAFFIEKHILRII